MALPNFEAFMLTTLQSLASGTDRRPLEVANSVADLLGLSSEDRGHMLASGRNTVARSRTNWALTFLKQAALVRQPARGLYRITDRGLEVLSRNLPRITVQTLEEFDEFRAFQQRSRTSGEDAEDQSTSTSPASKSATPEEALDFSYKTLRAKLVTELIDMLRAVKPERFETIVIDVLGAMGYGGGHEGAARAIGRAGDGGIDGVIEEDRLGLDTVYVQAKRWEANVGRPTVQAFAGALQGQRAHKGVMITTSDYSADAKQYVANLTTRIVLINGQRLAEMMIDHDVGVSTERTYAVKRLDSDYFEE